MNMDAGLRCPINPGGTSSPEKSGEGSALNTFRPVTSKSLRLEDNAGNGVMVGVAQGNERGSHAAFGC